MGGLVTLGYDLEGRKLVPHSKESELVCKIFSLYLKLDAFRSWQYNWIGRRSEAKFG